jgi:pimeloyl-ACP methyl ester carboxylesterase
VRARFPYLSERERCFDVVRRASILVDHTVRSKDGRRLAVFTAGDPDAPTVLMINPLGASCLFLVKLIAALTRCRRIVTWETPGLPDSFPEDPAGGLAWDPQSHAQDLAAVLAATAPGRIDSVIAYCSGSYLALHAIALGLVAPSRIALVSPPLEVRSAGPRTLYQQTIPPLLVRVARDGPKAAALVRAIMQRGVRRAPEDNDYELHVLNNLPFSSDESVYRYACLHAAWQTVAWPDALAKLVTPTAIFHGSDDELVHGDTVASLAMAISSAQLWVYERQGHFAVYTCDALIRDVANFATEAGAASALHGG